MTLFVYLTLKQPPSLCDEPVCGWHPLQFQMPFQKGKYYMWFNDGSTILVSAASFTCTTVGVT